MKKNVFCGILLVLAAMIAIGSVSVFGPCIHDDGSEAICVRASRWIFLAGCVLAVLTALTLAIRKPSVRIGLLAAAAAVAAAGIALPGTIFPVCRMDTMRCRAVMQPAMMILFAAALIVSACGIITERNRSRRKKA